MIAISEIVLIIIVQTIIMLLVLSGILFFLLRAKNKKLSTLQAAASIESEEKVESPLASVEYYITAELKLSQSRFDMLFKEEDLLESEFGEPDWITLRTGYLEIERTLLTSSNRMDDFWLYLGDKLRKLLSKNNLVKRLKIKDIDSDDEEEVREMKSLLKAQYDDFDSLSLELAGQKSEEEVKKIKEKLMNIIRSHTELSHCVHVLESENSFLRDQIHGLVSE